MKKIVRDAVKNTQVLTELYDIAVAAIDGEKKIYSGIFRDRPETVPTRALKVLAVFDAQLVRLRRLADQHRDTCDSGGLKALMQVLSRELTDYFFAHFRAPGPPELHNGMRMSVHLGTGNRVDGYRMLEPPLRPRGINGLWWRHNGRELSFTIAPRDETGAAALAHLRDRAAALSAKVLNRSAGHVLSFFRAICYGVGFYLACLNLRRALGERHVPLCTPEILDGSAPRSPSMTCAMSRSRCEQSDLSWAIG